MNFDSLDFGLPSSFNYTSKFKPALTHELENVEEDENAMERVPRMIEAPIDDPATFCNYIKTADGAMKRIMQFKKGTTTLAFRFKEGILIAVDSRASQGSLDSSEAVRKVIEINDYLLGTMAGGAADCQYWETWLAHECRKYELKHGERVSVAAASRILINLIYYYRKYGLSMGCMLAGCDQTGSNLYYLDSEGMRVKSDLFSVGSGSLFAYGVLDTYYKWDLSLEQAIELGKRAIYQAVYRDAASGGVVRVYHVHANGWTKIIDAYDVNKLHYEYAAKKGQDGSGNFTGQKLL